LIVSFKDQATEKVFNRIITSKFPRDIQERAYRKLLLIHFATCEKDLATPPGNQFEKLTKDLKGKFSIRINEKWRIIFDWKDGNASGVHIKDYH
jgi:proteic killer suppression protein